MANLVIRDRNGEEVTYEGVEKVKFNTPDGGTQLYSEGDTVENIPIALNFSEGDQTVEAPSGYLVKSAVIAKPESLTPENIREGENIAGIEGTLPAYEILENVPIALDFSAGDQAVTVPDGSAVKSAIIQQPETLVPENIAEGVDIAGVIGTLAAGGGNGVIATGTFSGNGSIYTLNHNLGIVPDLIYIYTPSISSGKIYYGYAVSTAMHDKFGINTFGYIKTGDREYNQGTKGIEDTTETQIIRNATSTTITIGRTLSGYNVYTYSGTYSWFAIGGLT